MLLTLFLLTGILVITLGAAELVMSGIRMNRLTGYSTLAFFSSEAGLERALWTARQPGYSYNNLDQPGLFSGGLSNGSSYTVDYATSTPNVTFTSTGSYGGAKRSVESTFEPY